MGWRRAAVGLVSIMQAPPHCAASMQKLLLQLRPAWAWVCFWWWCRYRLVKEQPNRPAGEALDYIIMQALDPQGAAAAAAGGEKQNRSLLDTVGATMASMQRFMRSLSQ